MKNIRNLKTPYFRVFTRNHLPEKIHQKERGNINLDEDRGYGTHRITYKINGPQVMYFDSYGNLPPPLEMVSYFNSNGPYHIQYNYISKI